MHFLMQSFVANKEEVGILRTQDYSFSQHCWDLSLVGCQQISSYQHFKGLLCLHLFTDCLILKMMKALQFFKMSVTIYQLTQC